MCGIAGWMNREKELWGELPLLTEMTRTLTPRGPDSEGYFSSPHCLLGHRRLAVVDLSGGAQPMRREYNGKHYVIAYNGEIYNADDLRREMKEVEFSTASDTEVVLAAVGKWGDAAPKKLLGIFAFAVWCEEDERLLLVRDQMGVKPLFYTESKDGFLFASELKAILAHPAVEAAMDEDGIMQLLGLGPARSLEGAVFRGIYELPPAYAMTIDRKGVRRWEYWRPEAYEFTDTYERTKEKVRALFLDAVRRQLKSDVPLCTFLSGGLDSSAISSVAASAFREKGEILTTYSIDYEENDKYFRSSLFQPDSDSEWVDKTASAIGSRHKKVFLNQREVSYALPAAMRANDLPGMADVDSSLYLFCREIKKDFTVALSGECADEIFGGYPWFTRPEMIWADTFPWAQSVKERQSMLAPAFRRLPLAEYIENEYQTTLRDTPALFGEERRAARLREIMWLNMKWFMRTLLTRKDRMSMAWGLEVRVPFADIRLVELSYNIPMEMKYRGGREKGLLRDAFAGLLPQDVLWRKKSPYPKSHHPAFYRAVKERLGEIYRNPKAPLFDLVDRAFVKAFLETDGQNMQKNYYGQLMAAPQMAAYLIQVDAFLAQYRVKIIY